jgi:hypothetical protein
MDFMFRFFKRLQAEQLSVTDLHFHSHTTFRTYVDKLCSAEDSGWTRVTIPVDVEGFGHLKVRKWHPLAPTSRLSGQGRDGRSSRPRWEVPHKSRANAQIEPVQLVYRDPVRMLQKLIKQFAQIEKFCWRWAYTPEPRTADDEEVIEHPASAAWWNEQALAVKSMGGSLLGLQLYSDDTTLNNKRSRSAYPVYIVPLNGSYDLYKLLFPASVVAYFPVLTCPLKGVNIA